MADHQTRKTDEASARMKWRESWDGHTPVLTKAEVLALDAALTEENGFDSVVYLAHATTPKNPADPDNYLLVLSDAGRALIDSWRKDFAVRVNIEDHYQPDLHEEIREAVNQVLSRHGLRGSAEIVDITVPRVVVTVDAGMASVAVDGTVDVLHVDLDVNGDENIDEKFIDDAVAFERRTGHAGDVDKAIANARQGLECFIDTPNPLTGRF